ncbi:phosphoglycan beta 1,3 galactosyltransferase [Leishmania major strain Friedlin]|uniref:Phosphoglycan beta 1,3 galactosyltransferase n=1 Tax=Leishmania major TaxID=5664 RepID=E9AC91_LEIMA|nr:phosphoglycan beta 1,3 galactosyltransferase [Leishmania major strain Friedlin]CAG9567167.1 phosphoglycan_beta_1_-3_galactosyltransferase [Leishmania major strain Friedlin]CBZ11906.1 phosphoglycan beta 1,3 galactosyltransferase [Leishmania major strain Friedlin]|eukprot:XP_003721622.1 phosphoglycan beta 1,3 galactosyltransferase [Leishmania major strain Friedlin]
MSHLTSPILLKRRASTFRVCAVGDVINVQSLGMEGSESSASFMGHDAFTYSSQLPDTVSAISPGDSVSHEPSTCVFTSSPGTRRFRPASLTLRRNFLKQFSGGACRAILRAVLVLVLLIMLYTLVATNLSEDAFADSVRDPIGYLLNLRDPEHDPWSVLVQHEDAVSRLNIAPQQNCRIGSMLCSPLRIGAAFLPSWTLRVVERDCADCMDTYTYRTTVKGVRLHKRHGVYATSSAPLGRVGPMLLAMTSVTDDVNVRTELPQWEWLRHVYGEGFPTVGGAGEGAAQPRRPYLAVMGIPSTDQPARAALREAQRRTWLTYQEVARTENHFDAALLALYVFAAVEPKAAPDASESSSASAHNGTSAAEPRRGRLSALLPTTTEYKAATEALLTATAQAEGIGDLAAEGIVQRRMELRRNWNIAAVEDTPCADVISRRVTVGAETSALLYLSGALSLPVTPAFTSPAEYVCHASSALWQEALTHRNVVWIDMMTDRRPTTNKKLGEDGKWGLPVEVGMSQKLILWLEYAYHAFKNVPFIIKGDDDSYVKVPQFLSDVRYVMGGAQKRVPPPAVDGVQNSAYAVDVNATECAYWGSTRVFKNAQFNAGMTFMVHRLLAQVVLEQRGEEKQVDAVKMAMMEFDANLSKVYRAARFHQEDILMGLLIRGSLRRAREICPNNRVWYVREGFARFHDLHRGRMHDVTWSTVVAHRCTPADYYYLHHFFQKELGATLAGLNGRSRAEKDAVAQAAEWVAERRRSTGPAVVGWDTLPEVRWVRALKRTPAYDMAEADGVPVYHNKYEYWANPATSVDDGYCSLPQK